MLEPIVKFGTGIIMAGVGAGIVAYFFFRGLRQLSFEDQRKYRKRWMVPVVLFVMACTAIGQLIGYLIWNYIR